MSDNKRGGLSRRNLIGAAAAVVVSAVGSKAKAASNKKFKLKYAPNFGMFRQHAGKDPIDNLKFMADQGFRAMFDNGFMGRPADEVDKIRKEMDRLEMDHAELATPQLKPLPEGGIRLAFWSQGVERGMSLVEHIVDVNRDYQVNVTSREVTAQYR